MTSLVANPLAALQQPAPAPVARRERDAAEPGEFERELQASEVRSGPAVPGAAPAAAPSVERPPGEGAAAETSGGTAPGERGVHRDEDPGMEARGERRSGAGRGRDDRARCPACAGGERAAEAALAVAMTSGAPAAAGAPVRTPDAPDERAASPGPAHSTGRRRATAGGVAAGGAGSLEVSDTAARSGRGRDGSAQFQTAAMAARPAPTGSAEAQRRRTAADTAADDGDAHADAPGRATARATLAPPHGRGGPPPAPHGKTFELAPSAQPAGASAAGSTAASATPETTTAALSPGTTSLPAPARLPHADAADGAVLRNAAHLRVAAPGVGEIELHLRVRDGVAHLRVDGDAARIVEARAGDLSRALAGEGLALGNVDVRRPPPADAHGSSSGAGAGAGQHGRERRDRDEAPPGERNPGRAPQHPTPPPRGSGSRFGVRA